MTEQEALALKPGDRVEARYGTGWRVVTVCKGTWADYDRGVVRVPVCRLDLTKGGVRFGEVMRTHFQLRPFGTNYTPHVFADFLEESGFPDAADCLRKRFPLADGS